MFLDRRVDRRRRPHERGVRTASDLGRPIANTRKA
jgi:hypothetical protein